MDILVEKIHGFNELKIQSIINDSEEDEAESDPNSNIKIATYTTNGNSSHKLLTNREISVIIQGNIPPVNQKTVDGVATSRGDLHAVCTVLHKEIVTGTTRSTAGVLKDFLVKNWNNASGPIPVDRNTFGITPRTTTQFISVTGHSAPPISIGIQKIEGPRRSIIPQEARNSEPIDASVNRYPDKYRDPTLGWSKKIGSKLVTDESVDVYARGRMNFGSDTVLSEDPNFMNFRLSTVNTMDKLRSVIVPTIRVGGPKNGSNWIQPRHDIEEATADRASKTKGNNHFTFKIYFETMREVQDFEREIFL